MDLKLLLTALRARWKIALLVFVVVGGLVVAANWFLPKRYTATTSLVVDIRTTEPMSALLLPANMATQVGIIESDQVARHAVRLLKLDENAGLREQWTNETGGKGDRVAWLGKLLDRGLTVKSGEGSIIDVTYYASDPAFAADAANAFARAYTDTLVALKTGPSAEYARSFGEQTSTLRNELEKAQARLVDFQRRAGIVPTEGRVDDETARLDQLTAQLAAVQGQIADAQARQHTGSAAAGLPSARDSVLPVDNGTIQLLRTQIDTKEIELKEAATVLGPNHPKYRSLQAQLDELRQRLATETQRVTEGFAVAKRVGQRTEAELRAAIAAQKKKVIELKAMRDQMGVLKSDVDRAQNAYDAAAKRLMQTTLDSKSADANVTVLSPAVVPAEPSFPKPLKLMAMIGVILGLGAGIGAAWLLELIDRRVRSVDDLAVMLQLPVLGVIESGRKRPRALPRRSPTPLLEQAR